MYTVLDMSVGENGWPTMGENHWTSIARKMTTPNHHARQHLPQSRPGPPAPLLQPRPRPTSPNSSPATHPPAASPTHRHHHGRIGLLHRRQPAQSSTSPTAYLASPTRLAHQPPPQRPAPPPVPAAPTPAEKKTSSSHLAFSLTARSSAAARLWRGPFADDHSGRQVLLR